MMSELKNISVSNGSGSNESFVEIEEIEEESVETFREVFGESESSFHNASLNNIVEKVEINEAIKEIQEKIKEKTRGLKKNNLSFFGIMFGFAAVMPLVILLSSVIDSLAMMGFGMLFSLLLLCYRVIQSTKKENALIQEIGNLERKMLEKELDGKLIGDPVLNDQWNLVKVQQNSKIVEYMVRIIVDENDNESFEIRELK